MESVKLTVILLMVCTVTNVAQHVCSNGKVIFGLARNSADISNAKSGILHNKSLQYAMLAFSVVTFVWLTLRCGITSKLED